MLQAQTGLHIPVGEHPKRPAFLPFDPVPIFWRKACRDSEHGGELPGIVQLRKVGRHRPDLHRILHLSRSWLDREQ